MMGELKRTKFYLLLFKYAVFAIYSFKSIVGYLHWLFCMPLYLPNESKALDETEDTSLHYLREEDMNKLIQMVAYGGVSSSFFAFSRQSYYSFF